MKTAYGKLTMLLFGLIIIAFLFIPMRAGDEDSLTLSPRILKMSAGDSYKVVCRLSSDDSHQKIRFETSDDRVASINSDGTVYAISSGTAVIKASASGGAQAQLQVEVNGTPMRTLSLNTDSLTIEKGQYSGLTAQYNSDASDKRLQWVSADESIATVDQAGRVYGVRGGYTKVYVNSPNGLTASANVCVNVDSIAAHITPYDLTVGVGASVQLKVSYLPLDSTDSVRRWSSSDNRIISVDADGIMHANGVGEAYVSIISDDGTTAGIRVKVEEAPRGLQLDPTKATLDRNDELDMQLRILNDDDTEDNSTTHLVVWNSSDPKVASVDQTGHVVALRSGTTKISATCDGITAVCEITVQVSVHEILLESHEVYLLKEETTEPIQLKWVIDPLDADDSKILFSSNNEQVAFVSENGLITMTGGYGTAVITLKNSSGAQATFTVNVVTQLPTQDTVTTETSEKAVDAADNPEMPSENLSGDNNSGGQYTDDSGFGDSGFGDSGFGDGGSFASYDNGGVEAEDFEEDTYAEFRQ